MAHPDAVNLDALSDLCTPWCLRVAVTLRIAERIAEGKTEIAELAAAAGCDAECLHSVLGHLVRKGVFEEPARGRFALNDAARRLLDPMERIGLDLEGIGGRMSHGWSTLLTYVRTGRPAYDEVFGRPFWEDLEANPEIAASFDALIGPTGHGAPNPAFSIIGGWESVGTVVDVGGGTGAMLAALLRLHPAIRGTLVDLPRTVARSADVFEAAGVADRATAVGQSFFDPLPSGADLYLLRGVLNDWPDRDVVKILRCTAEAARPGGRIVILKGFRSDEAPTDLMIEMVLAGGKQRTVAEFRTLAREAGLDIAAAGRQPSGYFAVECHLAD
jgi:SAM-dependent methyltransferase